MLAEGDACSRTSCSTQPARLPCQLCYAACAPGWRALGCSLGRRRRNRLSRGRKGRCRWCARLRRPSAWPVPRQSRGGPAQEGTGSPVGPRGVGGGERRGHPGEAGEKAVHGQSLRGMKCTITACASFRPQLGLSGTARFPPLHPPLHAISQGAALEHQVWLLGGVGVASGGVGVSIIHR